MQRRSRDTLNVEIIWTHSLDYDTYLEKRTHYVSKNKHNKGIFIDNGTLVTWSDFMSSDGGNEEGAVISAVYKQNLCQFMTKVEDKIN